jgi:phage repressor protein C with HTH and peptisase S24 domain
MRSTMGERLREARRAAGFTSARSAAIKHGWGVSTYAAHENGQNEFDAETAEKYARAFKKTSAAWLLTGEGPVARSTRRTAKLVGYVGAGGEAQLFSESQGDLDEVEMPPDAPDSTVAVQVRGDSMYPLAEDGWLVYYDQIPRPPTDDLLGKLCVLGLEDGRVLLKRLMAARTPGLFDLHSLNAPPMFGITISWAARVTWIKPH